ncbi:MAG: SIR2 family protein [Saprospiraceae bacterium]|nr:SIR2 family protein [Saprospiraceae bacterium]MBK9630998.1 SIR2 family protein [Saprospiraceae bacterium]
MNKTISILIGSGFSYPANIPSVSKINTTLTTIAPEDIFWGMDRYVFLLEGQQDDNAWMHKYDKLFFVEFIDFYCSLIGGKDKFNYEIFYDAYYSFQRENNNKDFNDFCNNFRKKYKQNGAADDNANLFLRFNECFNQILRYLLGRGKFYENNVHDLDYNNYDNFIKYLVDLVNEGFMVSIHTLNHDLLFDHIGKVTDIQSYFCDGYSELGTKYFGDYDNRGDVGVTYKVRLKSFQNLFNKPIRFYKLHGSIDTYSFSLAYPDTDRTRVKAEYGVEDFYKEVYNEKSGCFEYKKGLKSIFPDFLSGTTEKLRNYSDEYYDIIFNHFKKNLKNSDKLLIIGYGFKDKGINEILKSYLDKNGKPPVVIDPNIPNELFYQKYKFNHIQKSISSLSHNEWKGL